MSDETGDAVPLTPEEVDLVTAWAEARNDEQRAAVIARWHALADAYRREIERLHLRRERALRCAETGKYGLVPPEGSEN